MVIGILASFLCLSFGVWIYEYFYFKNLPRRLKSLVEASEGCRTIQSFAFREAVGVRIEVECSEASRRDEFSLSPQDDEDDLEAHYRILEMTQRGLGAKGDRVKTGGSRT